MMVLLKRHNLLLTAYCLLLTAYCLLLSSITSFAFAAEEAVITAEQTINCSQSVIPISLPGQPVVLRVNLTTGQRSIISATTCEDLFVNNQSLVARDRGWGRLTAIAVEPSGSLIVGALQNNYNWIANGGAQIGPSLYRVDTASGNRKLLTDFFNPSQGILLPNVHYGIAEAVVDQAGRILVSATSNLYLSGKLFAVDPSTGNRSVLSDSDQSSQGGGGHFSTLALAPLTGQIFVDGELLATAQGNFLNRADVFAVSPTSGFRTPTSDFRNAAQGTISSLFQSYSGLAANDSSGGNGQVNPIAVNPGTGQLYAVVNAGTDIRSALFSVDPTSGFRTLVSDFGNSALGRFIDNPIALKVTQSGQILLLDDGRPNTAGALVAIDPQSGSRTVISDFSNPNQGTGSLPTALALGTIPATVLSPGNGGGGSNSSPNPTLTMSASSSTVRVGLPIVYNLVFTNGNAANISNVILTAKLSNKTKWVSTNTSLGKCRGKSVIVCKFNTVNVGGTISINITALAKKLGATVANVVVKYKIPVKAGSKKLRLRSMKSKVSTTILR